MKKVLLVMLLLGVIITSCKKDKMYNCDCSIDYHVNYVSSTTKDYSDNYAYSQYLYTNTKRDAKKRCASKEEGLINWIKSGDSPSFKETTITGGGCEIK